MNSPTATAGLAHDLWNYVQEQPRFGSDYATFVASFAAPVVGDEMAWENLLWTQLQNLHRLDRRFYDWDRSVGSDPEKADFSFSFAETAFFVVGLNPASSRLSRKFRYPTLIFNVHAQFEQLREKNKFERMKQTIRERDLKLQGSLNPNLSNFGEQSEARQYSGRQVEKSWKCPFHAMLNKTGNSDD
jgi:FPC/CPF motif-containing protein YcgG